MFFQNEKIISIIENTSMVIIQYSTKPGQPPQIPQSILDDRVQRNKPGNIDAIQVIDELQVTSGHDWEESFWERERSARAWGTIVMVR